MAPVAIVTVLMLLQYEVFGFLVARARGRTGVKAPAVSGNPEFERYFRGHQNTLEQLIVTLPGLWIFAFYVNAWIAAALGLLFLAARFLYFRDYVRDPSARGFGFGLGMLASALLVLGSLIGAVVSLVR